jgi:DNA processing protein
VSGVEVLLAAAVLRVGAARLRALANDRAAPLREWIETSAARPVSDARDAARDALERLAALGARVLVITDAEYPQGLRGLKDAPPLLCVRGGRASPGGVAIIGSRTPSSDGAAFASDFARLIEAPLVSGLALGVDGAAHRGALEAGIAQVVYVGHGFGATYPPEHRTLENEIVAAGGFVATERLPDETATRWSLVRRDRLQAAHAAACVLIESERGGGAVHTMRFAAELGRPRFALEPRPGDPLTDGNALAIRNGAAPLPWDAQQAQVVLAQVLVRNGSDEGSRWKGNGWS